MDLQDTRQRLVSTNSRVKALPGESIDFTVPSDFPKDCEVLAEANLQQTQPFFQPRLVKVKEGKFSIEHKKGSILELKKGTQEVKIRLTMDAKKVHEEAHMVVQSPPRDQQLTADQVMHEVASNVSTSLTTKDWLPFQTSIKQYLDVFQSDLLGYNQAFGTIYANFEFATKTKPPPHKLRALAYGNHGAILFNQKCSQLKDRGVLIDPLEFGIQPLLVNNSWLIKKVMSATNHGNSAVIKTYAWL